ncbi:replication initiation protein [Prevotella melaninogenica]|uniref:RepB family plasmid replication initiator protein n=1 Tax=Prevotella melaninogenica TaxID=28132 RepID=A0A286T5U5_9BACT|nr:replication initiation protein [Prevotella melaninogenica]BBA30509.1 RepB family plasmid replication initiator protein [Prevotella melaninogenica]
MARTIKSNELAIQSYIFTTAKYDFNAYEKRIMYRLVELAQDEIKGIMIRDNMHKIEPTLFGREITMPVADILRNEKDQNYTIAKKAFRSLAQKGVEYEDDKFWQYTAIIANPKIDKIKGSVVFTVLDDIWRCLLDFTKGYRKYELVTAMQFKSVYSMRMYELMSGQTKPLTYKFEDLKERFGVKDKYKLVGHFKTRVLDIAKKELDECSPYSFNYTEEKEGRKVVGFNFFPTFNPEKKDPELYEREKRSKLTARAQISKAALDYLRYSFEFKAAEINKNKKTIVEGEQKIPDFIGFLSSLVGSSRTAKNRIGYVINAIKKKTAEI